MKIDNQFRNIIVNEIGIVLERMRKESAPEMKLYYFSALQGMTNRVLNIQYDSHLEFIDFVLTSSYNILSSNFAIMRTNQATWHVPNNFFEILEGLTEELMKGIEADREVFETLQKFSNLVYSVTGNGNYLLQKGMLKLPA